MKSYKDITYRYLKGQRNRTLLTIFGIILSVALICAIGTIIVSVRGVLIKNAIRENGSYHGGFNSVNKDNIEKIINHVGVEEYGISRYEGTAAIVETTEEERQNYGINLPYRYIEIKSYDDNALNMLPIYLKEGRFPLKSDEIVIEYWMAPYFGEDIKIGDKIKFTLGNRNIEEEFDKNDMIKSRKETFEKTGEREYTLVGFAKPNYVWRGELVTDGITGFDRGSIMEGSADVYIKLPDIKDANEKLIKIANDIGEDPEKISYNNRVLRLYAESLSDTFNSSIVGILIFVVSLIVISTVAVIYNAFNISVLERINQFGLLRSVGATPQQIRGIVLKEALILSITGIPVGLFCGVFAMKIVLFVISLIQSDVPLFSDMDITISGTVFLISTIVGLITVFLSAIGPARKAGKVSPLEAVRNTGEYKKESFAKIKRSVTVRKIFGIEGEIAYKNLRRNRKRFVITVFSMVVSIALFITFSSFSDYIFMMGAAGGANRGDFMLFGSIDEESETIYDNLMEIEDINRVYKVKEINGEVLLEEKKISKAIKEIQPYLFNEREDDLVRVHNVNIITIGDENFDSLKGLLTQGTSDIEKLNKENGVLVINNTYASRENGSTVLVEGYHLKSGDKFLFSPYDSDVQDEERIYNELNIMGVLEKGVIPDIEYNLNGSINIITTESIWNSIGSNSYVSMFIEMANDGDKEVVSTYLKELEETTGGLNIVDFAERAKEERTMNIIVDIFLYGFVAIITLISSINIINTISTNIILRTKEISMIKAVGMTQSGIKRMVAYESLFYGLYAAIFGGITGAGLSYILFKIVIRIREFQYRIPWQNIIIACTGATIIALLSGVYPLKRINDKVIVESMKSEN